MKRVFVPLSLLFMLLAGFTVQSCGNKKKTETTTTTTTTPPETNTSTAPVTISSDDSLKLGLADAVKDFPGVTATVNNGEVTLTGTIERDRLRTLIKNVNLLRPKKINNNLTIQ